MRVFIAMTPQPVAKQDATEMTVMDMYGFLPVYITEAAARAAHPNHQVLPADADDSWHPLFCIPAPAPQEAKPEAQPEAQPETPNTDESAAI
jgi:hypothetical protein